jgi:hypothetical protein
MFVGILSWLLASMGRGLGVRCSKIAEAEAGMGRGLYGLC